MPHAWRSIAGPCRGRRRCGTALLETAQRGDCALLEGLSANADWQILVDTCGDISLSSWGALQRCWLCELAVRLGSRQHSQCLLALKCGQPTQQQRHLAHSLS